MRRECPQCVYKHVTAAAALLLQNPVDANVTSPWLKSNKPSAGSPLEFGVLLARAEILLAEAASGYRAHVDLAAGCLAIAEHKTSSPVIRRRLRGIRLALCTGNAVDSALEDLHETWVRYALALQEPLYLGLAHLVEAMRECPQDPALSDLLHRFYNSVVHWVDPVPTHYPTLHQILQRLAEMYGVGPRVYQDAERKEVPRA